MNHLIVCVVLLGQFAQASTDGSSGCPDKAVRILAIGGEIQPNTWPSGSCGKSSKDNGRNLGWAKHAERQAAERAAYNKHKADDKRRLEESTKRHDDERKRSEEHYRQADARKKTQDEARHSDEVRAAKKKSEKGKANGH